jgi:hypothetical protein
METACAQPVPAITSELVAIKKAASRRFMAGGLFLVPLKSTFEGSVAAPRYLSKPAAQYLRQY